MISFEVVYSVFFFILGACFGSFGNVLIDRLPKKMSIVKPRSHCFKCKKPVAFYDNVPIFSYFILKGRCRNCGTKFSVRNAVVEFLSGLIFLSLFLKLDLTWTLLECLILCWGMFIASVIDLDHRILPDRLTLPGIAIGLLGAFLNPERSFLDGFWGVLLGGGSLWLVAYLYSTIKHEEGMGGGDIKLIAWIGAVLGWQAVIFSILVSSVVGSIVGIAFAFGKKTGLKTAIPFGPFLSFAGYLYIFVGPPLIRAYLNFFFPF